MPRKRKTRTDSDARPGASALSLAGPREDLKGCWTFTTLASACGVVEITVRRWVDAGFIKPPKRFGKFRYWPAKDGQGIVKHYREHGGFAPVRKGRVK